MRTVLLDVTVDAADAIRVALSGAIILTTDENYWLEPPGDAGRAGPAERDAAGLRVAAAMSDGLTFRGWWQAASCPPGYSVSGGSTSRQMSVAPGHRVWNLQPAGGSIGLGSSPRGSCLGRDRLNIGSGRGMAPRRLSV